MPQLPPCTWRRITLGSLLALGWVTACTPVATDSLEWTVANDTAHDLQVMVRYRLDSTRITVPDQLAFVRQQQVQDSIAFDTLGYYSEPLRWLSHQHRQWYFVHSVADRPEFVQYTPAGAIAGYAQVDRARGQLTYTLPPHSTQTLITTGYNGPFADLELAMTSLWLQQGATRRQILPGHRFADVFHAEPEVVELSRRELSANFPIPWKKPFPPNDRAMMRPFGPKPCAWPAKAARHWPPPAR